MCGTNSKKECVSVQSAAWSAVSRNVRLPKCSRDEAAAYQESRETRWPLTRSTKWRTGAYKGHREEELALTKSTVRRNWCLPGAP